MSTFVLTDIHGCWDVADACIKKAGFQQDRDILIVLGDLIDRGPQVFKTIDTLFHLQEIMKERCIILMGNHEQFPILVDEYPELNLEKDWKQGNGGQCTVDDLALHGRSISEYLPWLRALPSYYENDSCIYVHAGIDVGGLLSTKTDTFLWNRSVAEDGWYHGKLLLYGHTPMKKVCYQDGYGYTKALKPGIQYSLPQFGSIGLDTGCVFGYKLTLLVLYDNSTFEIFQESNEQSIANHSNPNGF